MTGAGDLDRRVQFQRATETEGPYGAVQTWANHGVAVWASRRDVSDGEKWNASEMQATLLSRFRVRWSSFTDGLKASDRFTCDGRTWEIVGLKQVGRREFVEITASTGND